MSLIISRTTSFIFLSVYLNSQNILGSLSLNICRHSLWLKFPSPCFPFFLVIFSVTHIGSFACFRSLLSSNLLQEPLLIPKIICGPLVVTCHSGLGLLPTCLSLSKGCEKYIVLFLFVLTMFEIKGYSMNIYWDGEWMTNGNNL